MAMVVKSDDKPTGDGAKDGTDAPPARRVGETPAETRWGHDAGDELSEGRARRSWYRRPLPLLVLSVVLVGVIIGILLWWLHTRGWETTDDAFISAEVGPVTPRISGTVLRVLVNQNQDVATGALLVEIDPHPFQNRLDQARAGLAVSQAAYETARAASASAEADVTAAQADAERRAADLKRYQALDPRVVAQQQIDAARAAAQTADAQLRAAQTRLAGAKAAVGEAQARIEQAQAAMRQAELDLSYTNIRAAMAGRVTQKNVQVGQYLQVGQPLMAIVPADVFIIANFKETQITNMHPGQDAQIKVDAYPDHTFHGRVESIQAGSGAAFSLLPPENATGNYVKVVQRVPVKIIFDRDDAQHWLLGPGMSAVPRVHVDGERDARPTPISPPRNSSTTEPGSREVSVDHTQ